MLKEKCAKVPTLVMEALWKDNGLFTKTFIDPHERKASFACALGLLRCKDARPLLENVLMADSYTMRIEAVVALGSIGDPKSVPALFSLIENTKKDDLGAYHIAAKLAEEKLSLCVDVESLEYLEKKAAGSSSEKIRNLAGKLIKEVEEKKKRGDGRKSGKPVNAYNAPDEMRQKKEGKIYYILVIAVAVCIGCFIVWRRIRRPLPVQKTNADQKTDNAPLT